MGPHLNFELVDSVSLPPASRGTVDGRGHPRVTRLDEARRVAGLQRGEATAQQETWSRWADTTWSVCAGVAADQQAALRLVRLVYGQLPGAARHWRHELPLEAQMAGLVWNTLAQVLEVPELVELEVEPPLRARPPSPARARRIVAGLHPTVRLVYLVDLLFSCAPADFCAVTEIDPRLHRDARAAVGLLLVGGKLVPKSWSSHQDP